jgi:hypothetical protein
VLNGSRRAAAAAATSKDSVFTDWDTSTKLSSVVDCSRAL